MNRYFKLLAISVVLCTSTRMLFSADSQPTGPERDQVKVDLLLIPLKPSPAWPTFAQALKIADKGWEEGKIEGLRQKNSLREDSNRTISKAKAEGEMDAAFEAFPKCLHDARSLENRADGVEKVHGCIDSCVKNTAIFYYQTKLPAIAGDKLAKTAIKYACASNFPFKKDSKKRS